MRAALSCMMHRWVDRNELVVPEWNSSQRQTSQSPLPPPRYCTSLLVSQTLRYQPGQRETSVFEGARASVPFVLLLLLLLLTFCSESTAPSSVLVQKTFSRCSKLMYHHNVKGVMSLLEMPSYHGWLISVNATRQVISVNMLRQFFAKLNKQCDLQYLPTGCRAPSQGTRSRIAVVNLTLICSVVNSNSWELGLWWRDERVLP